VKDKLEMMQTAAAITLLKVLSQHMPVGAEENHKNSG
jgi:hypothetical protein